MKVFVESRVVSELGPLLRAINQPNYIMDEYHKGKRQELFLDDSKPICSIEQSQKHGDSQWTLEKFNKEIAGSCMLFQMVGKEIKYGKYWYWICTLDGCKQIHILHLYKIIERYLRMRPDYERGGGLVRAVVQDAQSKAVLMDAYMNEEAFEETLRTGQVVYYSRSRKKLWRKGEGSGHVQLVREIRMNCYRDSLLLLVEQVVGACHKGYMTCFYRRINQSTKDLEVIEEQVFDPDEVYKK